MGVSLKKLGIDRLNIEERLEIIEEIWATLFADPKAFPPTPLQRTELERRVADDDAFPEDVVPWEKARASAMARIKQ